MSPPSSRATSTDNSDRRFSRKKILKKFGGTTSTSSQSQLYDFPGLQFRKAVEVVLTLIEGPLELVDATLIGPFIDPSDELLAQGILSDVSKFLLVFDAIAKTMMKGFALPFPRLVHMTATEQAFPEFHPLVYPEMQIARCAKEVHVIGHNEIVTDQPGHCFFTPDFGKRILYVEVGHPGYGIFGVDGNEENVWFPAKMCAPGAGVCRPISRCMPSPWGMR